MYSDNVLVFKTKRRGRKSLKIVQKLLSTNSRAAQSELSRDKKERFCIFIEIILLCTGICLLSLCQKGQ